MEKWKAIAGYEGIYEVSNLGNIRSVDRINPYGRKIKGGLRKTYAGKNNGYLYVNLCKNGKTKNALVHRLVALAFVPTENSELTVNHINEIKVDNRAENLEWMTLADNLRFGTHNERAKLHKPDMSGSRHPNYGRRGSQAQTHKGKVIGVNKNDPTDVIEFDTAATASRVLGVSSGQLCEAINGKAKSCGGYYWRRVNG